MAAGTCCILMNHGWTMATRYRPSEKLCQEENESGLAILHFCSKITKKIDNKNPGTMK